MSDAPILIHVRFAPDGVVNEIGARLVARKAAALN